VRLLALDVRRLARGAWAAVDGTGLPRRVLGPGPGTRGRSRPQGCAGRRRGGLGRRTAGTTIGLGGGRRRPARPRPERQLDVRPVRGRRRPAARRRPGDQGRRPARVDAGAGPARPAARARSAAEVRPPSARPTARPRSASCSMAARRHSSSSARRGFGSACCRSLDRSLSGMRSRCSPDDRRPGESSAHLRTTSDRADRVRCAIRSS
jgi:hypothetical protein